MFHVKPASKNEATAGELAKARGLFALEERRRRGWPKEDFDVAALAAAVNRRTGLAYTYEAARGWIRGALPKDRETRDAVASELGFDQNWLYFGGGEAPPGFDDALPELLAVIRVLPLQKQEAGSRPTHKVKRRPKGG